MKPGPAGGRRRGGTCVQDRCSAPGTRDRPRGSPRWRRGARRGQRRRDGTRNGAVVRLCACRAARGADFERQQLQVESGPAATGPRPFADERQ